MDKRESEIKSKSERIMLCDIFVRIILRLSASRWTSQPLSTVWKQNNMVMQKLSFEIFSSSFEILKLITQIVAL